VPARGVRSGVSQMVASVDRTAVGHRHEQLVEPSNRASDDRPGGAWDVQNTENALKPFSHAYHRSLRLPCRWRYRVARRRVLLAGRNPQVYLLARPGA
jgi:hypothetical protein